MYVRIIVRMLLSVACGGLWELTVTCQLRRLCLLRVLLQAVLCAVGRCCLSGLCLWLTVVVLAVVLCVFGVHSPQCCLLLLVGAVCDGCTASLKVWPVGFADLIGSVLLASLVVVMRSACHGLGWLNL